MSRAREDEESERDVERKGRDESKDKARNAPHEIRLPPHDTMDGLTWRRTDGAHWVRLGRGFGDTVEAFCFVL